MKRHIGKIKNTDQRCAVVFMQVPDAPEHCLVVSLDTLPPMLGQNVYDIVMSPEGQAEINLADALSKRIMADTRKNVLLTLHEGGHLMKVSVDNIIMTPDAQILMPLRELLILQGRLESSSKPVETAEKFNRHVAEIEGRKDEERTNIARNLLTEAELLESEARRKREQAYGFAPHLRPKAAVLEAEEPQEAVIAALEDTAPETKTKARRGKTA